MLILCSCSPLPLTGRKENVVTGLTTSGNTFQTGAREPRLLENREIFEWKVRGESGSPPACSWFVLGRTIFHHGPCIHENLVDVVSLCIPILNEKEPHFIFVPCKDETPEVNAH